MSGKELRFWVSERLVQNCQQVRDIVIVTSVQTVMTMLTPRTS